MIEEGFVTRDIYGRHYRPAENRSIDNQRIGIVLLHPITLHGGWLSRTAKLFAQEGFDVWVLDLPGHGKSKGKKEVPYLADISLLGKFFQAVDFDTQLAAWKILEAAQVIKQDNKLDFLVGGGLSFGGIILSRALALDKKGRFGAAFLQCYAVLPEDIKKYQNVPFMLFLTRLSVKLFGVAPAPLFAKMSVPLKTYFRRPSLGVKELIWLLSRWAGDADTLVLVTRKTLETLYYARGLSDPDIPLLLLQPTNDSIVGDSPGELAQRLSRAEILKIKGGSHQILVDGSQDDFKAGVVKLVSKWIWFQMKKEVQDER